MDATLCCKLLGFSFVIWTSRSVVGSAFSSQQSGGVEGRERLSNWVDWCGLSSYNPLFWVVAYLISFTYWLNFITIIIWQDPEAVLSSSIVVSFINYNFLQILLNINPKIQQNYSYHKTFFNGGHLL